jgi:hypothetical protein
VALDIGVFRGKVKLSFTMCLLCFDCIGLMMFLLSPLTGGYCFRYTGRGEFLILLRLQYQRWSIRGECPSWNMNENTDSTYPSETGKLCEVENLFLRLTANSPSI